MSKCTESGNSYKDCKDYCGAELQETAVGPFGDYNKRAMKDVPVLVKTGVECQSSDKYSGKGLELRECASLVYFEGGSYLVYGTGPNAGWCYMENTSSESCPEGWQNDDYDFYKLTTGLAEQSVGASCGEGCLDYIGEWMGDGVCDTNCRGCSEYYKNGVFDGGDCPTEEQSVGAY